MITEDTMFRDCQKNISRIPVSLKKVRKGYEW